MKKFSEWLAEDVPANNTGGVATTPAPFEGEKKKKEKKEKKEESDDSEEED